MVSLLSRVIWTTWVSCSCKALSTCGQTIRKVTIKSRTWRASSPCRGTSSCTIRWFCFARSVRRTRMAMRNPHPTVSSTLWRYRQRFGLIYMILSDIYKQELVCGWTYMCDTKRLYVVNFLLLFLLRDWYIPNTHQKILYRKTQCLYFKTTNIRVTLVKQR